MTWVGNDDDQPQRRRIVESVAVLVRMIPFWLVLVMTTHRYQDRLPLKPCQFYRYRLNQYTPIQYPYNHMCLDGWFLHRRHLWSCFLPRVGSELATPYSTSSLVLLLLRLICAVDLPLLPVFSSPTLITRLQSSTVSLQPIPDRFRSLPYFRLIPSPPPFHPSIVTHQALPTTILPPPRW